MIATYGGSSLREGLLAPGLLYHSPSHSVDLIAEMPPIHASLTNVVTEQWVCREALTPSYSGGTATESHRSSLALAIEI